MAKREFKKRAKITQRLNEISRLEDPWEKAESLLKFLRKVDRSLLSETCRLADGAVGRDAEGKDRKIKGKNRYEWIPDYWR